MHELKCLIHDQHSMTVVTLSEILSLFEIYSGLLAAPSRPGARVRRTVLPQQFLRIDGGIALRRRQRGVAQ